MDKIQHILIDWYQKNKRDLPWRHSKSAYHIWLSEIIMQQTQVVQGTKYFVKFINTYQTITDLANANEDEILSMWQGLGYYNRAKNLHYTAKHIRDHFNGIFPENHSDIIKLKGVGTYTAAAISTFAFNKPYPLVDGNVYRLYSRLFCVPTEINTPSGQKEFLEIASNLLSEIDTQNSVIYNQAIMEYGALICTPKSPKCSECQLQSNCISYAKNIQLSLPKKRKSKPKTKRELHYFFVYNTKGFWVQKRDSNDIWNGLYQLPLIEVKTGSDLEIRTLSFLKNSILERNISVVKHLLTHQTLTIYFHKQELDSEKLNNYELVNKETIRSIGFPQVIYSFLQKELNLN